MFSGVTARRMHILFHLVNIFLEGKRTFVTSFLLWESGFCCIDPENSCHDALYFSSGLTLNIVTPDLRRGAWIMHLLAIASLRPACFCARERYPAARGC